MAKKKAKATTPDIGLGDLLQDEGPKSSPTITPFDQATPVIKTELDLTIDQIDLYDRNPRLFENDQHDTLKAAIRFENDCNGKISVTKRPGAKNFMVDAGANTRIKILKELFEETGDLGFYHLRVTFKPYTSEMDLLLRHMKENDVRSDFRLIERALGVRDMQREYEETNKSTLSTRELADYLVSQGYPIDSAKISRFNYAIDVLYPVLPNSFEQGLGIRKVANLRSIDTKYRGYWVAHDFSEEEFSTHWQAVLSQHDHEDLSVTEIASDMAGIIRDQIKTKLHDYPRDITADEVQNEINLFKDAPEAAILLNGSDEDDYGWVDVDSNAEPETSETDQPKPRDKKKTSLEKLEKLSEQKSAQGGEDHEPADRVEPEITQKQSGKIDILADMRSEIRAVVTNYLNKLGDSYGIPKELFCSIESGYGFYMQIPDLEYFEGQAGWLEPTRCIWWKLFMLSRSDSVVGIDGNLQKFRQEILEGLNGHHPDQSESDLAASYFASLVESIDVRLSGDPVDVPASDCSSFSALLWLDSSFDLPQLTGEIQNRIVQVNALYPNDGDIGFKAVGVNNRLSLKMLTTG